MLGSSWGDPVIGIDIHFEMVPTPAPTPTPIPNPFTGIVFDPAGLAVGLALTNAINVVTGAPPRGPVLFWGVPATNTGANAKHVPGHILIPPGVAWAPFPKTPKPMIRPGETPKPGNPIKPDDDAVCVFGSKTVSVMGTNAVRFGEMLMSCAEPVRLPSSVVMAVPKGPPIMIGGPTSLDVMSAIFASLRTRFVSDSLHALLSRMQPSRFRNLLSRAVCFFTGHPVDVASGRLMTDAVDVELPGPLPLRIERVYSSAFAARRGPLGHGWSWSLDQAVWEERGRVVLLAEDGRELEFDTFDFHDHRMRVGDACWHAMDRLTLRRVAADGWTVESPDGVVREFAPVAGRQDGRAMLQRTRSRGGFHQITFHYDQRGRLEWVRDSAGRLVRLEHDDHDRIVALQLPSASGVEWEVHRRYEYSADGDLVRVTDSRGESWGFAYVSHLLTRETDRVGLSFYFAYDGMGEDAWCIRTWGDGGIYDHVIAYDKQNHLTYVTDSLQHTTTYKMNVAGLVIGVVDPLGGETRYEYDDGTLQRTAETDPLGNVTRFGYDARGNRTRMERPDGSTILVEYDAKLNVPARVIDANAGEWRWYYDDGHLVLRVDPLGRRTAYAWEGEQLRRVTSAGGATTSAEYDGDGNISAIITPGGGRVAFAYDHLGRIVQRVDPRGGVERRHYDAAHALVRVDTPDGTTRRLEYNAEGHLVRVQSGRRRVAFRYAGRHRVHERAEAGTTVRFSYDTEDRMVAVENEAGERYELVRNACGDVVEERRFDGTAVRFRRDAARRVVAVTRPSGQTTELRRDALGRVTEQRHSDGTFERYAYGADGALSEAVNGSAVVRFDRDVLGRVTREHTTLPDGTAWWVANRYDAGGHIARVASSDGHGHVVERDIAGRVHRVEVDGAVGGVTFEHDIEGAEIARVFTSGVVSRWQRDVAGRPIRRTTTMGSGAQDDERYEWEDSGELRAILGGAHEYARFQHDDRGRLVSALFEGGVERHRAMDSVGNVYRSPHQTDRRYTRGGRVEVADDCRFTHDLDGNLIEREDGAGLRTRYHWRGGGMLDGVDLPDGRQIHFTYDALARRIAKRVYEPTLTGVRASREVQWHWDGHFPLTTLDTREGSTTWVAEPGTLNPLLRVMRGKVHGVLTGPAGSPTTITSERGTIVERIRLDPFGTPLNGAPTIPFVFAGQWRDEETSLAYNVFRYYSPDLGRYISPDPLGIRGGVRAYGYVQSPVTHGDPFGLINPWDVLFTQDSIGDKFLQGPWAGRTLEEAIAATREAGALPEGLSLNVMRLNDAWVTLNNRTLYVAQEAGLTNVRVNDVGPKGANQLNRLLDGKMPLEPGEQPEVRPSCGT